MIHHAKQLILTIWNRIWLRRGGAWNGGMLDLGYCVRDGEQTRGHVMLANSLRTTHIAVLGKTGTGKSSLLRYLCMQDIATDRGFLFFDLHGDATPFLLRIINARERRLRRHLSDKLVLIEPADPFVSVGLNPLAQTSPPDFVRISEFAEVLKERWGLDHFGARTDELLRNTLYALAANGLTLLELGPFLTHRGFRIACLNRVENQEIRAYFESRYDPLSDGMQAVMREPILNKTSAFTADPRFRHIVGQARSTFSLKGALDEGYWVIVNLAKGQLGEQSLTLGSLLLTMLKNAIFARTRRALFTVYCDEIQNFVAFKGGIDTMLSEARKFDVAFVVANQFLDQHPPEMRAAILAGLLKSLPPRYFVLKSGAERWREGKVPAVATPDVDSTDLLNRSRYRFGRGTRDRGAGNRGAPRKGRTHARRIAP